MRPCCFDCLSEDVTVKLTDEHGFEHWFCAEDWEANQRDHDAIMKVLADGAGRVEAQA